MNNYAFVENMARFVFVAVFIMCILFTLWD